MSENVGHFSHKKKLHKSAKEAKAAGEALTSNAQVQEAFTSSIHKHEPICRAAQTQAEQKCYKDEGHLNGEESYSPIHSPPSTSPLKSTSFPSLHRNSEYTNRKFCGSEINLDSVSQESCSRREFNDSFLPINAVEIHSAATACEFSSTLSSSSPLPLSSSSPSICCYTIASRSKAISKLLSRSYNSHSNSNNNHKQKRSRSLIAHSFISNNSCPSIVIEKSRTSEIPNSLRPNISAPPVPPKPSKGEKKNNNKSKNQDKPYIENQENDFTDQSYYDPASFRRKLQRFEKQNTLIGKSKNNVTSASDKDEDDQGDERCEILSCFPTGNSTNSDESVSDISCVGSIKSVSVGGGKDCGVVYTEIRRSNNSINNINNKFDTIERENGSLQNNRECRVDYKRKCSRGNCRKTLRYDNFGRLKSVENNVPSENPSVNDIKLSRVIEQPLLRSSPDVTLQSAVIIRKLTPKLSKKLSFSVGITSRRCASDDSLILRCLPYSPIQNPYDQENNYLSRNYSQNTSDNQINNNSSFSGIVSVSSPSVTDIENKIKSSTDLNHRQESECGRDKKIFKSLSDTNKANRFYELIADHGNLNSIFHSTSVTDIQNCILSELDINSSRCLGSKKNLTTKCGERKDFDECDCCPFNNECMLERFLNIKIASCNDFSHAASRFENLCRTNNSSDITNFPIDTDKTDNLSGNSSSSSPAQNFASPIVRGPLVLKRIPTIESLGYVSRNNEPAFFSKEIMMEKRRNTLDRWQRLGFGRKSSPSTGNQERSKKSTDKSERLKELTELLRRNRSSPTPPPVPPPRKPKIFVSAPVEKKKESSIEKNNDSSINILLNQSENTKLMDKDEETAANKILAPLPFTEGITDVETFRNDVNLSNNNQPDEKLKSNTKSEPIPCSRDMAKISTSEKAANDDDISTVLSRPESRTVIGSYTRKGIPFRSASFSQIDYSSGKYIGAALSAFRDRLRREKISVNVAQTDQNSPLPITQTMTEKSISDNKSIITNTLLNKDEFDLKSCGGDGKDIPELISEENSFFSFVENKNELESNVSSKVDNNQIIDKNKSDDVSNDNIDLLDSSLATLVEEEIPLESPPDNFLQTATTCLIPVPVYECAAQEWNMENPPQEWVDVAPDEFGVYSEPVDSNLPVALEVVTSTDKNEPSVSTSRDIVPTISVSQHNSMILGEIEEENTIQKEMRSPRNHKESIEHSEVKKRYSHDDMEIGIERRSSLDCSLHRLCNNAEDRKRIDKSKRRKGMYIETDWVECPEVPESTRLHLQTSFDNFNVVKNNQPESSSSLMYLNSPHAEDTQPPGSLHSLNLNSPESEYNRPPIWTKTGRRTSLSYQSSEERDESISLHHGSHTNQSITCIESLSDNESDQTPADVQERSSPSPALSDQDFKRYSKRPLRGPYGQMLEAEMKKPNRLHFEEILEELKDSDSLSIHRFRGGHHENHPRNVPQYSNSFRVRKSNTYLPIPTHTRAASTPSQIENTVRTSGLSKGKFTEKRYQSTIDNASSLDKKLYSNGKPSEGTSNRLLHKKSSSLVPLDKQVKRNVDELILSQSARSPSERSLLPDSSQKNCHGKDLMPTPELLAELLQGASEKLVSEQRQQVFADTRTHVVQEIFRNEQSYVESLQTVVLKYFKVLKTPEHAGMIDSRTVDEIFFMVPDILAIHEKFLSELKSRLDTWEPQQKVGDAFIETFSKTEVLEVYTSFVNNCSRAKNAIRITKQSRPSFAKFLETTAREHKGKLTLDNLLIKPVQKFPNYEMLFTRLIKHTDEDHPDQKHLQEVLKLVHDILVHINCKEREILENGQREATLRELEGIIEGITELISPDRQFLLFDLVLMPSGQGARKERGFFLFNDLLVITSIKRRSGTIRKPNTSSCPGSVASTLDTNKYKFLTKVSLDNLEIIKAKDENLRKIMNEIEQLADDCNKLQQIAEVTATIKYPHQILEDVIRDLHRDVQRQLSERQSNDTQLNMLELTVNSPNGSQKLSIIFSKSEKRSQWEESFNEAKQKLAATLERHPIPEFITSIPIVKTRAGLQFTCAAPTLSEQKDVWVCNSDGYVGQVCVMSLSPEPNVTSCNGVCNARILCLASVPACNESETKSQRSSLNDDIVVREFRKSSSPNCNVSHSEKKKLQPSVTSSDIQLDSNSSSDDSEPENPLQRDRIPSPSQAGVEAATAHHHQHQDSYPDESEVNQSTMWLGTEDGYIHVYNCTDTIRIKKNKIKIQHASPVYSILYLDNRVFVSLANGDICVYHRDSVGGWNTSSPLCISIGTVSSPVNKLLNVHGRLWCSIQGIIKVLDTKTLQVVNQIQISSDSKPITNMAVSSSYVWISIQNSAHIKCFHSNTHQLVTEVNLAPAVNKMLSNCDDIIRQHKAACLRVTSLLSCKDLIWIGTSAGVLLTIPAHGFEKGSPNVVPTGIPHGHTGHVRFLTFVETTNVKNSSSKLYDEDYKNRRSSKHSKPKSETGNILIISGGDGYEDFRNCGANSLSEIAGREDSTNHLLIWQI